MKTAGIGLAMAMIALAGTGASKADRHVVVYAKQDNCTVASLGRAQQTARRVFAEAGVTLVFRSGSFAKTMTAERIIEIQFDCRVPGSFHPGAFGFASPYAAAGTRIHIFCDRVMRNTPDAGTGTILGYVISHEIGHVLEGVSRHSEEGVMKAHWEASDYRKMKSEGLSWDPIDCELIGRSIEVRSVRIPNPASPVR